MTRIITLITAVSLSLGAFASKDMDTIKRSPFYPDELKFQFAGNIGLVAGGIGYDAFGGKLNCDLLVGYLPEYIGKTTVVTFCQKNTYNFNRFKYKPISKLNVIAGFSVNIESGRNSFLRLPEYYPDGYYSSNAITFGFFAGLKYSGKYRPNFCIKRLEYYAEVGTLATYMYYVIHNQDYYNTDIYSLALGMNLKF